MAAILWEESQRGFLLISDRLGHYAPAFARDRQGGARVAASAAELLRSLPDRPPLDELSLVLHLCGPPPLPGRTFFRGVETVPPAHWVSVRPGRTEVCAYWQPEGQPVLRLRDENAYAEALGDCLAEVMSGYAPDDCGVTVTSGIDSTTVAATLLSVAPGSLATGFSWSSPELPESNEHPIAQVVARDLGLPLVEVRTDRAWPLSGASGEPLSGPWDPFRIYYHEVWDDTFSAVRNSELDFLLTGAGGDELFGGEVCSYADLLLQGRWLTLLSNLRRHMPHSQLGPSAVLRRLVLRPLLLAYSPVWQERLMKPVPWLATRYKELYRRTVAAEEPPRKVLPARLQRLRMLRDRTLSRSLRHITDQGGHHGVRLLHPLLDRRLVEFAARLPSDQTYEAGRGKMIVRRAMRGILPDEVLERRHKMLPISILERGLKEREQARVRSLMSDMRCAEMGLVDESKLRQHYREYLNGRHRGAIFWYTLTLEDWLRHYF